MAPNVNFIAINEILWNLFQSSVYLNHHNDVIMGAIASQITSLPIVYSTVYSDEDQRKHQSSASLAFVRGIHWGPVNSPHKWPVTRKMFPFDDVIIYSRCQPQAVLEIYTFEITATFHRAQYVEWGVFVKTDEVNLNISARLLSFTWPQGTFYSKHTCKINVFRDVFLTRF